MRILCFFLSCIYPFFLSSQQTISFFKRDNQLPTLINSVSFHPNKNLFCVTFTHHDQVVLYKIEKDEHVKVVQVLKNPKARLNCPQNAIFSSDGNQLIVVNWSTRNFNIYTKDTHGYYSASPKSIIPCHLVPKECKPHGMDLSPDGQYLAVAYGSLEDAPWAIVLYRISDLDSKKASFSICSCLQEGQVSMGVPKGIAFSPDGSSLLVSFITTNTLGVFSVDLENGQIDPKPMQEIKGDLSRPEEVIFSSGGSYFAVSNSNQNTVSYYQFDKVENRIVSDIPFKVLGKQEPLFLFPHGLGFSSNDQYFVVTQFGLIEMDPNGSVISWGKERLEGFFLFSEK